MYRPSRREATTSADVAVQTQCLVLSEDEDAAEIGVDAVGKCDVDDAIESAAGNGGLGTVASEGPEAFALAALEEYNDGIPHIGHWLPSAAWKKRVNLTIEAVKKTSEPLPGNP